MKNWYILFVQTEKQSQLCLLLEQEGVHAFLPMIEEKRKAPHEKGGVYR